MSAQVSRADLLRALHLGRDGTLALEHTETVWWGYAMPIAQAVAPAPLVIQLPPAEIKTGASVNVSVSSPKARSPLRMPEAWVAERLNPKDADEEGAGVVEQRPPLRPEDLQPLDEPKVRYQDLVPLPRLVRPLGVQLRQTRPSTVDVPALLRASAHRRWPRALPRNTRQVWPQTLVVLLDFAVELFPYRHDMYRVAGLLQARVPKAQLQVRVGWHGPYGRWEPLADDASPQDDDERLQPQPGHTYLIISDLGLLRPDSGLRESWSGWLAQAQQRQCPCVALAPVAADAQDATLAALVRVLRWSPDSRWAPERGQPKGAGSRDQTGGEPDALQELLACLAGTVRMDPPLLRALRQHSSAAQDASLEGRLWAHPDVRATSYATLGHADDTSRPGKAAPSHALWAALRDQVAVHHAHWPLGMKMVDELQQLAANATPPHTQLEHIRIALRRLAGSLRSEQGDQATFAATADYVLRRVPAEARPLLGAALDALAEAAGQPTGARQRWCLLQRGEQLHIAPTTDTRPPGPGVVLCSDLGQAAPGELVRIAQPQQPPQYLPLPAQGVLALPPMKAGAGIVLGGEETQLLRRHRTRGMWGWAQSDVRLVEMLDLPCSEDMHLSSDGLGTLVYGSRGHSVQVSVDRDEYGFLLTLGLRLGLDDSYMRSLLMRFRYLEPATYLQGSPKATGDNDERPQHPVALSHGLWLAETPCTQALWQAVMGKNPSYFKRGEDAPRRPVENVSWDDAQTFLKALQRLLPPGCEAALPTESQWEYACRAGTQTAYWWGDEPDDGRANWNEQQKATTPVDRYPPNPWGLHDMHGNVWEWCADGRRDYADSPERDPEGPGDGDSRVVRGGSWFSRPDFARGAPRGRRRRGDAVWSQGFRFALRSPSGPQARPGGLGASRRVGVAGGLTVGADAPAAELHRRDADNAGSPE